MHSLQRLSGLRVWLYAVVAPLLITALAACHTK